MTSKINKICFAKSITDEDGFIQITIPRGAYDLESLNDEIKRINFDEGHFTGVDYPFTIKPNFSTPGSIIEISRQEPLIDFLPDDTIRIFLGFNATQYMENIFYLLIPFLSPNI